MSRTAIISGAGALPSALAAEMENPLICALDGFAPAGLTPEITFRIERLVPFFEALLERGVSCVAFAGAVQRPRLDPALFDAQTAQLVPRLVAAMQQGDDATLREVIALFEEAGLKVLGPDAIAPALLPSEGVYAGAPSPRDRQDAERGAEITQALGAADVGQGCVVVQGLCLAVEALPGTDAMLAHVAGLPGALRPDPAAGRGVFYKAAKPGQERRVDLPTLGPDTVAAAARAGLGGIAWEAGSVICLDFAQMARAADEAGIFLWAR